MRIVIGYDDSECARAALTDLSRAGLPRDAEVLVLSVVDAFLPPEGERVDETLPGLVEVRAKVRDALRSHYDAAADAAARLRASFPGWTVHAEACADSPAWAIVKRAEGLEGGVGGECADLAVVGSEGKSGLQRLLLGSVSGRVLDHAHCSVRIARPRAPEALASPPRIVIGVDGSPDAVAAVEAVAAREWPRGTRVLVVAFEHGVEIGLDAMARIEAFPRASESRPLARDWAEWAVEQATALLQPCANLEVEKAVDAGDPKPGLIERARTFGEHGADCVFVGARGLRRIERFLLGSVSTRIARAAPCSVEVVRAPRGDGAA